MIITKEALKERIRIVAEEYINGASRMDAYRAAGYSSVTSANAAAFFEAHKDEIQGYVFLAVGSKVPIAIKVLEEIMLTGKSDGARVKAATEILDRAGVTQVQKIEITSKEVSELENRQITEEIQELLKKSRLKLVGGTDA